MVELPPQTNPVVGQQGMAKQASSPQQTTAVNPNLKPGQEQSQNQMAGKKSKKWIWILVGVVALIAIVAGAWLLFFS